MGVRLLSVFYPQARKQASEADRADACKFKMQINQIRDTNRAYLPLPGLLIPAWSEKYPSSVPVAARRPV